MFRRKQLAKLVNNNNENEYQLLCMCEKKRTSDVPEIEATNTRSSWTIVAFVQKFAIDDSSSVNGSLGVFIM